jgi:hypothetical protein
MTPGASSGGGLAVTINDRTFSNALTYAVSGLTGLEDEKELANKTAVQLLTWLIQNNQALTMDYSNNSAPYYVDLPSVQQYNVTSTDHCICVWGQSSFVLSASSTMGNIINNGNNPTLVTVPQCREIATITGLDLADNNGNDLTNAQVAKLLELASAKLIGFTNNKIVLSTYFQEGTFSWEYGIRLKKTPVVDFLSPQVRQPIAFNLFSAVTFSTVKQNYNMEPDTGWLVYKYAQNMVDWPEPFSPFNDVIVVYVAGFGTIPQDIVNSIVQVIPIVQGQYLPGVKRQSGGSYTIEYFEGNIIWENIISSLTQYFLGQ